MSNFTPISDVVHAPNRRGVKRYTVRVPDGVSKLQVETLGYFGKYDFAGWQPGDLIQALCDFGILGYVITGADDDGHLIISILYYYANSAGLIDASEVPMNPVIETGPIDEAPNVQEALELLNLAVKDLITSGGAAAIVSAIAASAPLTAQLWAAIVLRHFEWDGTTLKIDIDGDGDGDA